MRYVLTSFHRETRIAEYFQPTAMDQEDPGITWTKAEAKQYSSQEEAALAIPAFLAVKREQRKRISRLFGWPDNSPPTVLDPITIESLTH